MIGIGVKRTSGGGPLPTSPDGIDELILAMGGWKTNGVSPITPSITMSRPSNGVDNPEIWVAPCAVVFDATATTDTAVDYIVRDCLISWDYGDDKGEFWPHGARPGTQSKNRSLGPIGGHLYTEAGEYTITLTVLDAYGNINTATQTITVTDPNTVFAGTKTICFSNTEDFTGAPVGATKITTSDYTAAINGQIDANTTDKRLMFKGGDTFVVGTSTANKTSIKRIQICSFGTGKANIAILPGIAATNLLNTKDSAGNPVNDIQIYDLKASRPPGNAPTTFYGGSAHKTSINNVTNPNGRITLYNIECVRMFLGGMSGRGNAVVGCTGGDGSDNTYQGGVVNMYSTNISMSMFAGNIFDNNVSGEHNFRMQGYSKICVESNTLLNPSHTKHCMAIRGSSLTVNVTDWAANTTFDEAFNVIPLADRFKLFMRTALSGASPVQTDATEPDWSTAIDFGDTITDGGYIWMLIGKRTNEDYAFAYPSGYANIQNNWFGVPNPRADYVCTLMVQIACGSPNQNNEPEYDLLFEGNHFAPNLSFSGASQTALELQVVRGTVRNNTMSVPAVNGTKRFVKFIGLASKGTLGCDDVFVANNSFFCAHTKLSAIGALEASITGVVLKNNIFYAPSSDEDGASGLIDAANPEVTFTNCSTLEQMQEVDPLFSSAAPTTPEDFNLQTGSYAIGSGADDTGLFLDFHGTVRDRRAIDMGAISKDS